MWDEMRTSLARNTDPVDHGAAPRFRVASSRSVRRLKLCFISETVSAGVGQHLVDAIRELSQRGHEIHLIYSPLRTAPECLAALMDCPNVSCEAVPMPRALGTGDICAFRAIRTYVRANGPFDLIHGHSSKGGGYARLLKLYGFGPVFYSPHAFVTLSPITAAKRIFYHGLEWTLARLTDRIVCTSECELRHARGLGIARARLALICNGAASRPAPQRTSIRAKLGLPPDRIVAGFAGRMEDQKAPQRLIAAARRLLPELPELTLLMIGEGPMRPILEAGLDDAGLNGRVIWLGSVDARQYMPAMDMFVLPSLYEGFPYVLLEALHAGLPIVSTPVGGSHECVTPGLNGMIVPHDLPEAMAAAIRTIATDGELRRRMGETSAARAERFSIPRMVDAMEDLYSNALGLGRSPVETRV